MVVAKLKKSKEFEERKKILELEAKNVEQFHKFKMEQLKYQRITMCQEHEKSMERQRIKSAEIRKTQMRRMAEGGRWQG